MKNLLWLILGIAGGFVIAHEVNKTQEGRRFFTEVDTKAREFGAAVAEGYHQREAELRNAIDEVLD